MTDTTPTGDVAAALAYATEQELADTIDLGHGRILVRQRTGDGGEKWLPHDTSDPARPQRSTGTVQVYDADSFAAAVSQRAEAAETVLYVDAAANQLTAVLNDDIDGTPGFRDYRVVLCLRPTPEWQAWFQGKGLGDQERFAKRIEDGEREIETPPAAEMLTLAQTFHAAKDVRFKSGHRLQDGQHQLQWEETINATAGAAGSAKIPETFTLALAPFVGSAIYRVYARLRYRIVSKGERAGELSIGYELVRPEDIMSEAFTAVADGVAVLLSDATFISGPAPTAVR